MLKEYDAHYESELALGMMMVFSVLSNDETNKSTIKLSNTQSV